jgi:Family of unknown function (DUF6308)
VSLGQRVVDGYRQGVMLPPSLQDGSNERAVILLRAYYAPLAGKDLGFTGGRFDTFDRNSRRSASTNTLTGDDILSLSLVSTSVLGRAALELLTDGEDGSSASSRISCQIVILPRALGVP